MASIDLINEIRDFTDFVSSNFLSCPDHPTYWESTNVDKLKSNFCRYTKRTMYYAENFVNHVQEVKDDISTKHNLNVDFLGVVISDKCYFDFDAFIISCKSLLDKNFVKLSADFNPKIKTSFNKFAKNINQNFIEPILKPIRDEVVHLNQYGSSIGSIAHIKNGKISIKAFYNNQDLESLFYTTLLQMNGIIGAIGTAILQHECLTFGFPKKEVVFQGKVKKFKLSDFIIHP